MKKLTLLLTTSVLLFANPVDAETIAFTNAKILTADTAGTIDHGTVVMTDGRIVAVGHNVFVPADAKIVDLVGKTLTPGFVVSDSLLGMVEISGGANAAETSSRTPVISAGYDVQDVINPHTTAIPVARKGGVTTAVIMPNAGAGNANFAGHAALLSLGENPEIVSRIGMVWEMRTGALGRGSVFVQLQAELDDVRRYAKNRSAFNKGELNAKEWSVVDLDALVPVIEGKRRLAVRVDRASDILALLRVARQEKIKLILVGAAEGWMVAEQIAQAGVPVMLDPTNNLPSNFDEIGASADNAARLFNAGVDIVLRGGSSAHDAGKLRYFAGMAVARGLPYEAALKAVTVTPARIWGADNFGTIAVGQRADLAIWSGDPFEPLTQLTELYIKGESQSLESRQDLLEVKYIEAARSNSLRITNRNGD